MSAWTGIAVVAIGLGIALVAVSQPVWEWHLSGGTQTETWSYGFFGVTHTVQNGTSGGHTVQSYTYANLTNQGDMDALFLTMQDLFDGMIVATIAAGALSAATLQRKLRGLFAALALLGACLFAIAAAMDLLFAIPAAAVDLPRLGGYPITNFEGEITQGTTSTRILTWGPSLGWYLVLVAALALAFGASEMWSLRPPRMPTTKSVPAPVAETDLPPPPPPDSLASAHLEPLIEEIFVIGANGLLIKHMSRTLMSEKDRDVVGGMISVVSNFVRESFSERDGSDVEELSLGNHRFILCNERGLVVAVLVTRGSKEDIEPRLRRLATSLLDRYGEKLDHWSGERLEGVEDEIAILWKPFFPPPPPSD